MGRLMKKNKTPANRTRRNWAIPLSVMFDALAVSGVVIIGTGLAWVSPTAAMLWAGAVALVTGLALAFFHRQPNRKG